jgi:hypothetical protein
VWCVSECDREASIMRGPYPTGGCCVTEKKNARKQYLREIYSVLRDDAVLVPSSRVKKSRKNS